MPHALVVNVSLEGRSREEGQRILNEQIVPAVKQAPGFQRGVWLRAQDGLTGMGLIVFDSEDNLNSMRGMLDSARPADAPPITGTQVFEVAAEA